MQKFKFAELNGFQWKLLLIFSINLIRFLFSLWNKLRGKLTFGYSSETLNKQLKIFGRLENFPLSPHLGVMFIKFQNCIRKRTFFHTNFSLGLNKWPWLSELSCKIILISPSTPTYYITISFSLGRSMF